MMTKERKTIKARGRRKKSQQIGFGLNLKERVGRFSIEEEEKTRVHIIVKKSVILFNLKIYIRKHSIQ